MEFAYEALSTSGRLVRDSLEAADSGEALDNLRSQGLTVLKLEKSAAQPDGMAALGRGRPGIKDLVLFTRQMKMLLESGAALVPALEAIEKQTLRKSFRRVLRAVREDVESGRTLTESMGDHPEIFNAVFCSIVAAGEATAHLPQAFNLLTELSHRNQKIKRAVVSAMVYPALLSVLLLGVSGVLVGFVIPRFAKLFESLNHELPFITHLMLDAAAGLRVYWPALIAAVGGAVASVVIALRVKHVRQRIDAALLRAPVIGNLIRRLNLARMMRVWGALLRSHVPLLEAVAQSRTAIRNAAFLELVNHVEEEVSSGGRVGRTLAGSPLIEPVLASAISTGEENGRLAEAVDFVAQWLDDENEQLIAGLTKAAEPVLLAFMGLVVGLVALALFIPLFDIATAGG